ncbi:potassium transporter-domain-containing protein [Dactylonectria estremocensis]|uniref:Potassium transporter-domain-containing protein n=1 Tax=Dactylonectria estremocensis TaxID=1079267 RepID=A0A9P9D8E2_9HYPO|nr:potassium transporter-domain-containing protein [Dactylonectria estremocensis]
MTTAPAEDGSDEAVPGQSSTEPPDGDAPLREAWDIENEEKARQIADTDLHQKHKQNHKGFMLLWLAWQSTGVIYGDIGTSPLYVYSSTFTSQPSFDDLVGALSIIIWTLILIVTVKYCFIVLSADDDGQGGTFALYSLLARYTNIVRRDPNVSGLMRLDRQLTGDMKRPGRTVRSFLENSRVSQALLKCVGVLGVSMVMADGVLTPAQSVLGSIQGIRVANPNLGTDAIVGISCTILIFLFLLQPFGTSKIGTLFAPIVVIWLLFNLCCGIYNLALHDYTVLKAFSPHFAFAYLVRNGRAGWESLGGLLLAFTGVEALFADLGAFGKRGIQLSWLCLALPCLLMAYIGQAAYISVDPTKEAYTNPFFNTLPPGSLYFGLVIAVLATVVASQAMITSSFQLLSQVMRLSYFPHIKTIHTSKRFHDQVYMPLANWLLMIGTVIVTAVYNNTTSLGNAYGVCVIIVTMITTCMVSLVAIIIWQFPVLIVLLFFLTFAALEGAFMSSALRKVPDGAWFTLTLAFILSSIFILWRWGKEQQWAAEAEDRIMTHNLFELSRATSKASKTSADTGSKTKSPLILTSTFGGGTISKAAGLGIFFDKIGTRGDMIPRVFTQFIQKFKSRPDVIIFFHLRPLSVPTVPIEERYIITRATPHIPSSYRLTVRHGYMDDVLTPDLGSIIVDQLVNFIRRGGGGVEFPVDSFPSATRDEVNVLDQAKTAQTVYVLGKQLMRIRRGEGNIGSRFIRTILLESFLWIRENSRAKLADLDMDYNNLVEVGFVKAI